MYIKVRNIGYIHEQKLGNGGMSRYSGYQTTASYDRVWFSWLIAHAVAYKVNGFLLFSVFVNGLFLFSLFGVSESLRKCG